MAAAKRATSVARSSAREAPTLGHDVYVCSCAELVEHVEAGSVDLVVADPPYAREFLPCWTELADLSAHALRPGGLLVAMSGQTYLPDVFDRLGERLTYHWTAAFTWEDGARAVQQFPRRVMSRWKPLLVFSNGKYEGPWMGDVVVVSPAEAETRVTHMWEQSLPGVTDVVLRFSQPGDLVCSPFLGSGTVGVAALSNGRRFVGCDTDPEAVETTRQRLGV